MYKYIPSLLCICGFNTFSYLYIPYVEITACVCVLSRSVVSDSLGPHGLHSPPASSVHGDSPGRNPEVGCCVLLQGIFPTQGWNLGLPYCKQG